MRRSTSTSTSSVSRRATTSSQGDYRWLTIRVPGEGATEISLEQPGPPLHDEATADQIRELITKGALGGLVFITDDARALYDTLRSAASPTSLRSPPSTSTALTWAFATRSATPSAFSSRERPPSTGPLERL